MISPVRSLVRTSATFADDEPVYSDLPGQIAGAVGPTFGQVDLWPGENVQRPANAHKASWRCDFPSDPAANLLVREVAFCLLHPTHPALRKAGIFVPPAKWGLRTVAACCFHLGLLLTWARDQDMPQDFGSWDPADWQAFIDSRARVSVPVTVRKVVSSVRHLIVFSPVLTGIPALDDPWPGRSSAQVANSVWTDELSTPAIPPEIWWPLLRAAWAYVDRFAPAILDARTGHEPQRPAPGGSTSESVTPPTVGDREMELWLAAAPKSSIPLITQNRGTAKRGEVNWALASKLATNGRSRTLFATQNPAGHRRRQHVLDWLADDGHSNKSSSVKRPTAPSARESLTGNDGILRAWLANADNLIPIHPHGISTAWAGEPNWTVLSRLVFGRSASLFQTGRSEKVTQRRDWVRQVARDPKRTTQTNHGINPRMLRAACYVFVAALTAMRDSENGAELHLMQHCAGFKYA